jgi:hypothetical protein
MMKFLGSKPLIHFLQDIEASGYKLYFASRWEFAALVTNFIFQKGKLASLFSRFAANCGYKLYFAITPFVVGK